MSRRHLEVGAVVALALATTVLAIFAILAFARVSTFVHDESVQRVHTIGERCEQEEHAALEHGPQEVWFWKAQHRCLKSLANVEARAHTKYSP